MQADFSFFFDTGGRRRCYIAPERFYESSSGSTEQVSVQHLQPEMVRHPSTYIFLGCAVHQLNQEQSALSQLLLYFVSSLALPTMTCTKSGLLCHISCCRF